MKTRVFYFRRVTKHIYIYPRRSKRSLKAVAQNSEKGKGFGPVVTIIGTSPTSVVSIHYLDLLKYCNLCVPFEDLSDVVGEDLDEEDNRDDTGDDENIDMLPPEEYATKFWNGTIDWGRVDLSFRREGESKRSKRDCAQFSKTANCGHQGLSWTAERNFTMLRIARLKTMNNCHLLYVALEEG